MGNLSTNVGNILVRSAAGLFSWFLMSAVIFSWISSRTSSERRFKGWISIRNFEKFVMKHIWITFLYNGNHPKHRSSITLFNWSSIANTDSVLCRIATLSGILINWESTLRIRASPRDIPPDDPADDPVRLSDWKCPCGDHELPVRWNSDGPRIPVLNQPNHFLIEKPFLF